MFMGRQHGDQGFTLIELLVVIAVIGVLAAIAVPIFLSQEASAQSAALQADLDSASGLLSVAVALDEPLPASFPAGQVTTVAGVGSLDPAQTLTVVENGSNVCVEGVTPSGAAWSSGFTSGLQNAPCPSGPGPDPDPGLVPSAPRNLSAAPGAQPASLTLSWDAPVQNFDTATDGYRIFTSDSADGPQTLWSYFTADSFPGTTTLTGLAPGQEVFVFVVAENSAGVSPAAAASGTPAGVIAIMGSTGSPGQLSLNFALDPNAPVASVEYMLAGDGEDVSFGFATSSPLVLPITNATTEWQINLMAYDADGNLLGDAGTLWCECWLE